MKGFGREAGRRLARHLVTIGRTGCRPPATNARLPVYQQRLSKHRRPSTLGMHVSVSLHGLPSNSPSKTLSPLLPVYLKHNHSKIPLYDNIKSITVTTCFQKTITSIYFLDSWLNGRCLTPAFLFVSFLPRSFFKFSYLYSIRDSNS